MYHVLLKSSFFKWLIYEASVWVVLVRYCKTLMCCVWLVICGVQWIYRRVGENRFTCKGEGEGSTWRCILPRAMHTLWEGTWDMKATTNFLITDEVTKIWNWVAGSCECFAGKPAKLPICERGVGEQNSGTQRRILWLCEREFWAVGPSIWPFFFSLWMKITHDFISTSHA